MIGERCGAWHGPVHNKALVLIMAILIPCAGGAFWDPLFDFFSPDPETTPLPTVAPTPQPTPSPTAAPTVAPTAAPTATPTNAPAPKLHFRQRGQVLDGQDWVNLFGGHAVALSQDGTIMAAGAALANGLAGFQTGQVRVFEYDANTKLWNPLGQTVQGLEAGAQLGHAVSLSADGLTLVVGAPYSRESVGQVLVFQYDRRQDKWIQLGSAIWGDGPDHRMGMFVDISDNGGVIAVGAPGKDDDANTTTGRVRVLLYSGRNWVDRITVANELALTQNLGNGVALSADGTVVASGGKMVDANGNTAGRTRILKSLAGRWRQVGQDLNTGYGAIAISADGLVVATGIPGHMSVYKYNRFSNRWNQLGQTLHGDDEAFGNAVAMSADGSILAVGAHQSDHGLMSKAGSVQMYWYDRAAQWWQLVEDNPLIGEKAGDWFGSAVALSQDGLTLASGARLSSSANGRYTGQVRVFGPEE